MPSDPFSRHGFARVAAAVPQVHLADADANVDSTLVLARAAAEDDVALLVCPELGLTGYSNQDLFHQQALLESAEHALFTLARREPPSYRRSSSWVCRSASARSCSTSPRSCTAVGFSGSCRSRTCRTTASSTRSGTSARPARRSSTRSQLGGRGVPFGTDLLFEIASPARPRVRCRDLRGPVGAAAAEHVRGDGRGDRGRQPLGQQPHHRQGGISTPTLFVAVGADPRRVRLCRRGRERIDDGSGLGRAHDRCRERQRARRVRRLRRGSRSSSPPTSTSTGWLRTGCARRASSTASEDHRRRLAVPSGPSRARDTDCPVAASATGAAVPVRARRPLGAGGAVRGGLRHPAQRSADPAAGQRRRAHRDRRLGRHRFHAGAAGRGLLHGRACPSHVRTCWPTRSRGSPPAIGRCATLGN